MDKTLILDGHSLDITHYDKYYFPVSRITKGELIDYYQRVAPIMLDHMKGRPLMMHRFPGGVGSEGFYQKDASDYFPEWIERESIEKKEGGVVDYVVCNNAATLVYIANQGCITPHLWLSRQEDLKHPDRLIFDLDPSSDDFSLVIKAAQTLREILQDRGLTPFVMTTGSAGLHVTTPLLPCHSFERVREFAHDIAQECIDSDHDAYTLEIRKEKRGNRVFIDTLRNTWGATAVAPYAVRALPDAPVATPLEWNELNRKEIRPDLYTLKNIFRRLGKKGDPWHDINEHAAGLDD